MKKYSFLDIFQEHPNGDLSPKETIIVNGLKFGKGVSFTQGLIFGGVDFHNYKYLDIAAEKNEEGTLIIKGFYE